MVVPHCWPYDCFVRAAYPVVVNVPITEIESLRLKAKAATEKFALAPSKTWVEARTEGVVFWFENDTAAVVFAAHCARIRYPPRRNACNFRSGAFLPNGFRGVVVL